MCVCVCACVRARACVCVCVCVVVVVGADGCIPLSMLVDICQCCRVLECVHLPLFKTLCLLFNLVNKTAEGIRSCSTNALAGKGLNRCF